MISEQEYQDTNDLFEGDIIAIGQIPEEKSWKFTPLFKEGNIGEIRVWHIGFAGESLKIVYGTLITSKGENGKLITSYHPIETNNSGRTLQEQAILEARKRYIDQYKSGYLPHGESLPEELNGKDPMLAKTWKPSWYEGKCKSNESRLKNFPVSVMAKYDGIRALCRTLGNGIHIRSRKNNSFGAPLTHIKDELKIFLTYLPVNSELDGELYSFQMGFSELSGVIKTEKFIHKKHDLVKYYIFDIIESQRLCWEDRYKILVNAYSNYVKDGNSCKTLRIIQAYNSHSEKEIKDYHDKFINEGYEGVIIRKYAYVEMKNSCCWKTDKTDDEFCNKCKRKWKLVIYRKGRTTALFKFKIFIDEECKIIGFDVGVGTEEGAILYKVRDIRGNEITVRPRGSIKERRLKYKERNKLLGKDLTIRYQEVSEKGVPRFPTGIAIRDYE